MPARVVSTRNQRPTPPGWVRPVMIVLAVATVAATLAAIWAPDRNLAWLGTAGVLAFALAWIGGTYGGTPPGGHTRP